MRQNLFITSVGACLTLFLGLIVSPCRADNGYAGTESCLECHEDKHGSYLADVHSNQGDPRTPGAMHGCESCHGPGQRHVDEGGGKGVGGILSLSAQSPALSEQTSNACMKCHLNQRLAFWSGSAHESRGLSCASCHTIHTEKIAQGTRRSYTDTCFQCHKRVRAELLRQSHHPIREGKMKCGDCHNPHGTASDKLVDAQSINLKCFSCHADVRGPFLWAHPPVVEDCLTCHSPHGSTHNGLLNGKAPYLCQRCHSNTGHAGDLYARGGSQDNQSVYRVLNNRAFYRACLNCHVAVHGSNHPSGKALLR